MHQFRKTPLAVSCLSVFTSTAIADNHVEEVYVSGGAQAIRELSGSATLIDEEEISRFELTDLNALLAQVPGVYIRQEDGYGLRPNINLRGTSSDRSSKITIMEDSILIGPAPYSAPAAYYIPNVARMHAVEVVKGPATVAHGPHTVGGAINFVTRPVPSESEGMLNLLVGEQGYRKARVFYGDTHEQFGYWLDALHYGADGFKELDTGGDTGFVRNDINTKLQWIVGEHSFTAKLGYADEDADETYLGLTDSDFDGNPNRRYAASQLDNFQSEHSQIHLSHNFNFSDNLKINTTAYWNAFDRAWNKLDGIIDGPDPDDILSVSAVLEVPDFFTQEYALLTGQIDSDITSDQRIDVTNNDRSFISTGIQSKLNWVIEGERVSHDIDIGLRFHHDEVEREHSQRGYFMQSSQLIFDGDLDRPDKADNNGETDALALYINDTIDIGKFKINAGLRYESIESSFEERALGSERSQSESYSFLSPGLGAFYSINNALGVLVGVNKGFSPNSASADVAAVPEESVNYEAGFRFDDGSGRFEAIGFFSDYENLLGRCRASDPCAGEETNGGAVEVFGLELSGSKEFEVTGNWFMPIQFVYTYTESEFVNSFDSTFPQWGSRVEAGYELPYLPQQQANIQFGLSNQSSGINVAINHTGQMREIAGDGAIESANFTEELTTINVSLFKEINDSIILKLLVDNITDEQKIVSRRPFGARPNQPRTSKLGIEYKF